MPSSLLDPVSPSEIPTNSLAEFIKIIFTKHNQYDESTLLLYKDSPLKQALMAGVVAFFASAGEHELSDKKMKFKTAGMDPTFVDNYCGSNRLLYLSLAGLTSTSFTHFLEQFSDRLVTLYQGYSEIIRTGYEKQEESAESIELYDRELAAIDHKKHSDSSKIKVSMSIALKTLIQNLRDSNPASETFFIIINNYDDPITLCTGTEKDKTKIEIFLGHFFGANLAGNRFLQAGLVSGEERYCVGHPNCSNWGNVIIEKTSKNLLWPQVDACIKDAESAIAESRQDKQETTPKDALTTKETDDLIRSRLLVEPTQRENYLCLEQPGFPEGLFVERLTHHCSPGRLIHLSFKDLTPSSFDDFIDRLGEKLTALIELYIAQIKEGYLSKGDHTTLRYLESDLLLTKSDFSQYIVACLQCALKELATHLTKSAVEPESCFLIIDHYDTPILTAPESAQDDIRSFLEIFYRMSFRDNNAVTRGFAIGSEYILPKLMTDESIWNKIKVRLHKHDSGMACAVDFIQAFLLNGAALNLWLRPDNELRCNHLTQLRHFLTRSKSEDLASKQTQFESAGMSPELIEKYYGKLNVLYLSFETITPTSYEDFLKQLKDNLMSLYQQYAAGIEAGYTARDEAANYRHFSERRSQSFPDNPTELASALTDRLKLLINELSNSHPEGRDCFVIVDYFENAMTSCTGTDDEKDKICTFLANFYSKAFHGLNYRTKVLAVGEQHLKGWSEERAIPLVENPHKPLSVNTELCFKHFESAAQHRSDAKALTGAATSTLMGRSSAAAAAATAADVMATADSGPDRPPTPH